MPEFSPGMLALLGAIFGGGGLKVIEHWLSKSKVRDDSATKFREDLSKELLAAREEARKIRAEMQAVEAELDKWKDKYYSLMDQFVKLRSDLQKITKGEEHQDW